MAARARTLTSEVGAPLVSEVRATYADHLRRRHPRSGDIWHLDKVVRMITEACHDLWRTVNQDGHVLDILRRGCHGRATATTFCRKLLKGLDFEHETRKIPAMFPQNLD